MRELWVPSEQQNLPAGLSDKMYLRLAPVLSIPHGAATGSCTENTLNSGHSPGCPLWIPFCHILCLRIYLRALPQGSGSESPEFPSWGCNCCICFLFQLCPKVDWICERKSCKYKFCQLLLVCKIWKLLLLKGGCCSNSQTFLFASESCNWL